MSTATKQQPKLVGDGLLPASAHPNSRPSSSSPGAATVTSKRVKAIYTACKLHEMKRSVCSANTKT